MKTKIIFSLAIISALILGSCGSTNTVGGGSLIQKRTYNKGIYLNKRGDNKVVSIKEENKRLKGSIKEEFDSQEKEVEAYVPTTEEYYSFNNEASSDQIEVSDVINEEVVIKTENKIQVEKTNEKLLTNKPTVKSKVALIKEIKESSKNSRAPSSDVMLVILVILAIILPPLAVFIFEGASKRFVIDLILWIIGWGVGWWLLGGLGWICSLAAIIYALLIVLEVI